MPLSQPCGLVAAHADAARCGAPGWWPCCEYMMGMPPASPAACAGGAGGEARSGVRPCVRVEMPARRRSASGREGARLRSSGGMSAHTLDFTLCSRNAAACRSQKKRPLARESSAANATVCGLRHSAQSLRGKTSTSREEVVGSKHQRALVTGASRLAVMHSRGPSVAMGSSGPPIAASTARLLVAIVLAPSPVRRGSTVR
mmetsp:Transcript_20947/g.55103  ORF Transcript_20947/g.55103 Transcript_20947/m.55103 type:complete len:201 (-) Transcript_20947:110-712(-)